MNSAWTCRLGISKTRTEETRLQAPFATEESHMDKASHGAAQNLGASPAGEPVGQHEAAGRQNTKIVESSSRELHSATAAQPSRERVLLEIQLPGRCNLTLADFMRARMQENAEGKKARNVVLTPIKVGMAGCRLSEK